MTTKITSDNINLGNTALVLPIGTLAQRPTSPANGMIRLNTSNNWLEYYYDNNWYSVTSTNTGIYSVEYLVIAGGGGGGKGHGGGGGAGGYLEGTLSVTPLSNLSITIGGGGAGSTSDSANAPSGSNSCITSNYISIGGGGGGSRFSGGGSTGGSGGGGGAYNGAQQNGGNGADGIAFIRYIGSQRGTGGSNIITIGGYTIHTFTTSGTYTA